MATGYFVQLFCFCFLRATLGHESLRLHNSSGSTKITIPTEHTLPFDK